MGCCRAIGFQVWSASHCLNELVSSAWSDPNFLLRATALQLFRVACHVSLHHAEWKRSSCLALPGTGEHPDDILRHFLQHGLQIERSAEDLTRLDGTAQWISEAILSLVGACLTQRTADHSTQDRAAHSFRSSCESLVAEMSHRAKPALGSHECHGCHGL